MVGRERWTYEHSGLSTRRRPSDHRQLSLGERDGHILQLEPMVLRHSLALTLALSNNRRGGRVVRRRARRLFDLVFPLVLLRVGLDLDLIPLERPVLDSEDVVLAGSLGLRRR